MDRTEPTQDLDGVRADSYRVPMGLTCSLLACACLALVACAQPASPTGPSAAATKAAPSTLSPAPTQKKADDGDDAGGMIGLVNPSPGCDSNAPLGPNGVPWESDHCDAGATSKTPPKKKSK